MEWDGWEFIFSALNAIIEGKKLSFGPEAVPDCVLCLQSTSMLSHASCVFLHFVDEETAAYML